MHTPRQFTLGIPADDNGTILAHRMRDTYGPVAKPAPIPADGGARVKDLARPSCACVRCEGKRQFTTINAAAPVSALTDRVLKDAVSYADAILARELQTVDSLYAQSVRNLTKFGEEYLPVHMQVLDHVTPTAPLTRSGRLDPAWSKPFDRDMMREIRRDAREAITRARFDTGPTDRLPVKDLVAKARPTFYPTQDQGQHAGYESAGTWQTLGASTQRARHGVADTAPTPDAQWEGLTALLDLAGLVADKRATVDELASAVLRLRPTAEYLPRVYDVLGHTARKKLAKLIK